MIRIRYGAYSKQMTHKASGSFNQRTFLPKPNHTSDSRVALVSVVWWSTHSPWIKFIQHTKSLQKCDMCIALSLYGKIICRRCRRKCQHAAPDVSPTHVVIHHSLFPLTTPLGRCVAIHLTATGALHHCWWQRAKLPWRPCMFVCHSECVVPQDALYCG